MDALEALLTRRAVREYTSQPVSEEQIQTLLTAAMHAPSACNQQPWHFVVVTSREQLDAIAGIHPYAQMLKQAPLAVIVCADLSLETCPGNWAIDCAAAAENLLLAARALGLGSVWVGIHPVEARVKDISALLGLPSFAKPLCLTAVGYPKEPLPKVNRFKPERVHRDRW
ncbi:MAG: nitroreductase family protein [Chloroflexi bacterium]|nr:MAG: nitroreductase family protein [Chloroflexota bacterium]